jgi:hypothetical protein
VLGEHQVGPAVEHAELGLHGMGRLRQVRLGDHVEDDLGAAAI